MASVLLAPLAQEESMTRRLAIISVCLLSVAGCSVQPSDATTISMDAPPQEIRWSTTLPPTPRDLSGCAPGYDIAVGILHISSAGGCNLPALIHIHGGGWFSGAATDMDIYRGAELANHIVYVSLEYPLFPATMPMMLASVQLGIDFLRTQHLLLGIDPNRIGLIGESAGGQLALQAGIDDGDLRFVGSLFGPTDMRAEETNFCQTFGSIPAGQQLCIVIHAIMGGTSAQVPGNFDAWSPTLTMSKLATHQQGPYFYFGESIGDLLVPVSTIDSFTGALAAHGLSVLNDRIPGDPGVIGHNLGPDKLNFLRARAVLDAINAMNGPQLPPPSFAPPPPPAGGGGAPPPAPPPSCSCSCTGQVGLATAASSATASTCGAAQAAAVPVVQNTLFADVLAAGPPWTIWYTEAIGIPVSCSCH